jgi:hypothetical protein
MYITLALGLRDYFLPTPPKMQAPHFGDHCYTASGKQNDFKGYTAEKELLKMVCWLALNKQTKLSYDK